ncbi:MAG: NAD+ synthase [Candidatus Omnitrophica bacterium]|nr:NAD+ synthase [Candidatus Omnitrophota bacterium]
MRIAIAQINTTVGDLCANHEKAVLFMNKAKDQGADIVVFPEMTICGYPPEDLLYKNHFIKDNIKALKSFVQNVSGITAVIGFVDQNKDGKAYNAAAVIKDKKIYGVHHKHCLPNYGVFDEKRYFVKGGTSAVFAIGETVFGVNICEDIWEEVGPYKDQVKKGAKVLINLSSSPYDVGKTAQRQKLLCRRAKENNVFVCYANGVGGQDELVFDGESLVVDPDGKVIASGKPFEQDLILVDLVVQNKKRRKADVVIPFKEKKGMLPALEKHIYQNMSQDERIYKALILGTRDYVKKNGFEKVVIGLSGGIDSALVAVIACKAIGKENVIAISMPSQFTSEGTRSDAKELAGNLGIEFYEIPVKSVYDAYEDILKDSFKGKKPNVAEENIQARIRGNILMAFSNKFGWLVLTTGNKSEFAVGYCTLYGDMTGGFAVIKDVPKTKVYDIARFINIQEGGWILPTIISRPPTAELRENQKDQDSLPAYDILDPLLKGYVEEHQSLAKMLKINKDKDLIKNVIKKVDFSEYKRRQAPPGIKITLRAFGKDWRLPITNKYKEE